MSGAHDPRLTPSNGRVAHASLDGLVAADLFTEGSWRQVGAAVLALRDAPGGARARELLLGARFCVLEERCGFAFGFAGADGYVGWVATAGLVPELALTHRVSAIRSYWQAAPDLKHGQQIMPLPFGAEVRVSRVEGDWARLTLNAPDNAPDTTAGPAEAWMPLGHLTPRDARADDPVAVAELFLGTPYVWGGNSAFGIDCSGLVQAALHAAGLACPGDSDMQMALGRAATGAPQRGDLLFWEGHVALVVGPDRMLHANAHAMAVAYEGIAEGAARIAEQGDGPVTAHRRL